MYIYMTVYYNYAFCIALILKLKYVDAEE